MNSLIKLKEIKEMLDMPTALRVTINCIRETGRRFPPSKYPIASGDTLISLNIDNTRIDLLRRNIAGNKKLGLIGLVPPFTIDISLLTINENSTVFQVFDLVQNNAVQV